MVRTLISGIGLVTYVYNCSLNKTNMPHATTINDTKEKEPMIIMQHWNRLYFTNLRIAFKISIKKFKKKIVNDRFISIDLYFFFSATFDIN